MLLQLYSLRQRSLDPDSGAVSQLHLSGLHAPVLPERVSVRQSAWRGMHGDEEAGPMLPRGALSFWYV